MNEQIDSVLHLLSYHDAILAPIYFLLLLSLVLLWRKRYYSNSPLKKYIVPYFVIKIICCVLITLLYEYYYKISDSHNYFTGAIEVWNATKANPILGLEIVFLPFDKYSDAALQFAYHITCPCFVPSVANMFRYSGFIGMFCFGTYLPIAMVFTTLCFWGTWKIFTIFCEEFPQHHRKLAIACLYAPSMLEWGNNIMKDPLCIFAVGLCLSAFYNFVKKRFSIKDILKLGGGALILISLKGYIFYFFLLAAIFALYNHFVSSTNNKFFKIIIRSGFVLGFMLLIALCIYNSSSIQASMVEGYKENFENIQQYQIYLGGSTYILPNTNDFSFTGILRTYLISLNVSLFRPYLWEIPNAPAIINALESFIILIITLYLLIKYKIFGFFTFAGSHPLLLFSLIFTLLLGPVVGLISFNFGTLSRYKIPILPFYYAYLVLLYYKAKPNSKTLAENNTSMA